MHFVGRFDESHLAPAGPKFQSHSEGYSIASLVDHTRGSVHTELAVNHLAAQGTIAPHLRSDEEDFYSLTGQAALQPKTFGDVKDTFFLKDSRIPTEGKSPDRNNLKGSMLAHFEMSQIPPMAERQDVMKELEGVFLNWLIDSKFGASHYRMAFIEYRPGGMDIGPHDHTFEESYFVLSGEIEGVLDGQPDLAKAGDILWTGCVHSFQNRSAKPVRWLETFSPQPPAENAFRFMAEWQKRAVEIEG